MGASEKMRNRKSTCLYLDSGVVETARRLGLNISRVSENALVAAIDRLTGPEHGTGLLSRTNCEGRGRDSNPGARLHRPVGYQATSPRPLFMDFFLTLTTFWGMDLFAFSREYQSSF